MQKWQLTVGLTGLALVAAALAPRLLASIVPSAPVPGPAPVAVVTPPPPSQPVAEGPLRLTAGLDHTAVRRIGEERFLVVEVHADGDAGTPVRRPVDLAVVLDGSGSMSMAGKIDHAKAAARGLARALGPEDTYALIVFDDAARVVRPAGPIQDVRAVDRLIDGIYEGGGTNLHEGLRAGGRELERTAASDRVRRVVVLSDGKATVGITDARRTAAHAATLAEVGVSVSTVGLGLEFNEDSLAAIADHGGGQYAFVDDPAHLPHVFASELEHTTQVVARRARVRLATDDAQLIEVIGWETTAASGGAVDVWLGDLAAGETRRIVARVRTTPDAPSLTVADVRVDYEHDGALGHASVPVHASVVSDAAAAASVDVHRASIAQRAWGNHFLERSTEAYRRGDLAASGGLLTEGRTVLERAATELDAPELRDDARTLERTRRVFQSNAPASAEGRRAIKQSKETFRGRVR